MKLVTAVIRPLKLDDVRQALLKLGHVAIIAEVKALTPRHDFPPGTPAAIAGKKFHPKVRIEVLVPSEEADKVVAMLRDAAQTGRLGEGDGVIFVSSIDHVVRIRTGVTDDEAI